VLRLGPFPPEEWCEMKYEGNVTGGDMGTGEGEKGKNIFLKGGND